MGAGSTATGGRTVAEQRTVTTDRIGLADAISALREELIVAQRNLASAEAHDGNAQVPRFTLGPVSMEFLVEVSGGGTAGVKFWVVEVGGSAQRTASQRITITLTPTDAQGHDLVVGDHVTSRPR